MTVCELSIFYWDSFRESVDVPDVQAAECWLRDNWGRLSNVSGSFVLYSSDGDILRSGDWQEGSSCPC